MPQAAAALARGLGAVEGAVRLLIQLAILPGAADQAQAHAAAGIDILPLPLDAGDILDQLPGGAGQLRLRIAGEQGGEFIPTDAAQAGGRGKAGLQRLPGLPLPEEYLLLW